LEGEEGWGMTRLLRSHVLSRVSKVDEIIQVTQ